MAIYTRIYDQHTYANTYDTKYCHRDHLGSVDVLTDESGAVVERDSFDAWASDAQPMTSTLSEPLTTQNICTKDHLGSVDVITDATGDRPAEGVRRNLGRLL